MSPAFAIIILMVLYPLSFTLYTAFTNYSDGHLLTKTQAINRLGQDTYLPEGGLTYNWSAFRAADGTIALWLVNEEGEAFFAPQGQPLTPATAGEGVYGAADEDGIPEGIEGYTRLGTRDVLPILDSQLAALDFGEPPNTVQIRSLREAAQLQPRLVYDPEADGMVDHQSGTLYKADDETGFFTNEAGENLLPGYQVTVGFDNYARLFNSPALRGPLVTVFTWTVMFAFLSVVTTFALGLLVALVLNDPIVPWRKLIRTLLILPYAIPGLIGILIWRGLLNTNVGVLTTGIEDIFGWAPPWFTDVFWARFGILLVNLWLGYPYMMLLCSGALQSIPSDVYEAAAVDGASGWQRFWNITFPLLLVGLGPLLIASFTFNFNNFTTVYAYNEGRPPIPGTPTPAGYTDILISYTFRLAFESGRGAQYAYAAAITIVIFLIVASITLLQYRFTKTWEEVGESV
jgi:ABC-type sugar transport system permease subunit